MDSHTYAGKRIAVVLSIGGAQRVVTGLASCVDDPLLGKALCITVDDPSSPEASCELLISEADWDGEITPASQHDCDYCFRPTASWARN